MSRDPDTLIGTTMAAGGSVGLTIQWATQFASLAAALINIALALAGGYLLYLRIRRARRDLRDE